ncbi:MAG: GxxExxY protein [Planctomycetes bacterium]|nr:GxxExxY protein [Planctomycetota bacterium]
MPRGKEYAEPDAELDAIAHEVIGAAIAVHTALGPGYLEKIYEEALCIELTKRGIKFVQQHRVQVSYDGQVLGEGIIDLFVEGRLVVELKAVSKVAPVHFATVMSYLKDVKEPLGLILNFQSALMKDGTHRVIFSKHINA